MAPVKADAEGDMSNKEHPSAKAPAKVQLNLGNLPPKLKASDIKASTSVSIKSRSISARRLTRQAWPRTPSRVNPSTCDFLHAGSIADPKTNLLGRHVSDLRREESPIRADINRPWLP